jgi:nucleoside-diphosphate-sugar epimerase
MVPQAGSDNFHLRFAGRQRFNVPQQGCKSFTTREIEHACEHRSLHMHNKHIPLTILGAGYVGRALLQRFPAAVATRRTPASDLGLLAFDLQDRGTWRNPPLAGRAVVWTFPAAPLAAVQAFYEAHLNAAANLIVLGSTSAYLAPESAESPFVTVTEQTPLDMSQPRVQGEEWLRQQGATVLQLAGIFGPGRDPADWLKRGLIKDGAKLVNLIHVDDIVAVITHLLAHTRPGERINLADGEAPPWRELVARFRRDGRLPAEFTLPESGPEQHGKRVDNHRLHTLLPGHRFLRP